MHPLRSRTTYTEALGDEVCVYDWARHEVHALNPTAAYVWQLCDGKTSVGEMAERLRERQLPFAEQLVELALEVFKNKHLLDANSTAPAASPAMSRRALVKRGLTAALLPVVASVVAPTPLQAQSPGTRLQTFGFTGTSQTFIVPPGFTSVTVSAFGAQGRGYLEGLPDGSSGGLGGSITATLAVIPGETLVVVVGGIPLPVGMFGAYDSGFNGGGRGGSSAFSRFAGPGGGASDVRRGGSALGNRVVVAGGGGGAGTGPGAAGGAGGGTMGGDGGGFLSGVAGTGGTQTAGGIGGVSPSSFPSGGGQGGVSGIGGDGGSIFVPGGGGSLGSGGGGGGGGYYGGGGGAAPAGAGGGSSFAHPSATGVVHVQGTRAGAGLVILSW
jgi:Glycine rich protein/Coenzyme PQQ synthesis protein D (PqqD)